MIKPLTSQEIDQVVKIHEKELPGFLRELGPLFLKTFYKTTLLLPEITTLIAIEKNTVVGFVTTTTKTKGIYKNLFQKNPINFSLALLLFCLFNPLKCFKLLKLLRYPGFEFSGAELLTFVVEKKWRRKGIGKQLLLSATLEFKKKHIREFHVSVYKRLAATKYYEKLGFIYVRSFLFLGEEMNYYMKVIS